MEPLNVSAQHFSFKPADLVCSITASEDQAGTKPIPNGGITTTMSTQGTQWVHVKVKNKGLGPLNNFTVKVIPSRAKLKEGDNWLDGPMSYTLSLPASSSGGASVTRHIQIDPQIGPHGMITVEITATADISQVIRESNEQNNSSTIQFRVQDVS